MFHLTLAHLETLCYIVVMYHVEFTAKASLQFRDLPEKIRKTIRTKLDRLAKNPSEAQQVKAMEGIDAYRLRVGDYRVIYTMDRGLLLITVITVGHRSSVYD